MSNQQKDNLNQAEDELKKATDAMERAASVMIASTKSFRQKIRDQDATRRQQPSDLYQPYWSEQVEYKPENISDSMIFEDSTSLSHSSASTSHVSKTRVPVPQPASSSLFHQSQRSPNLTNAALTPVIPSVNIKNATAGPSRSTHRGAEVVAGSLQTSIANAIIPARRPESSSSQISGKELNSILPDGVKSSLISQVSVAAAAAAAVTTEQQQRQTAITQIYSHPNPLSSHPTDWSDVDLMSTDLAINRDSFPSRHYKKGLNCSTASFGSSMHPAMGITGLRDSTVDLSVPLFPQATHIFPSSRLRNSQLTGLADSGGAIRRNNSLSRSFRRAAAHIPRLSPILSSDGRISSEKLGNDKSNMEAIQLSRFQEALFVLVICLADGLMLAGISQGIVSMYAVHNEIAAPRGVEKGEMMWYTVAYVLTAAALVLPGARLGYVYGSKCIFTLGFLWFALWSLLSGFAPAVHRAGGNGHIYFVVCRALQGMGPGMILPNGQVLVSLVYNPASPSFGKINDGYRLYSLSLEDHIYPVPHNRKISGGLGPNKLVTSLFGAAAPIGFVAGALMSALFAINRTWSWAFWTLAAVCLATFALALLALPNSPPASKQEPGDTTATLLDIPGATLLVSGLCLFATGWNEAPTCGWETQHTYFLVVLGLLVLAGWTYVERHAPFPLVPLARMQWPVALLVVTCVLAAWAAWGIFVIYVVRFLVELWGMNALGASARLIPLAVVGVAAALVAARLFTPSGEENNYSNNERDKPWLSPDSVLMVGTFAFATAMTLLATTPIGQVYWINAFLALLLLPLGMETTPPAAVALLEKTMPVGEREGAAWLVMMAVNLGISIGIGAAGTVERGVGGVIGEEAVGLVATTGSERDDSISNSWLGTEKVERGIRGAMFMGVGFASLALILTTMLVVMRKVRERRETRKKNSCGRARAESLSL